MQRRRLRHGPPRSREARSPRGSRRSASTTVPRSVAGTRSFPSFAPSARGSGRVGCPGRPSHRRVPPTRRHRAIPPTTGLRRSRTPSRPRATPSARLPQPTLRPDPKLLDHHRLDCSHQQVTAASCLFTRSTKLFCLNVSYFESPGVIRGAASKFSQGWTASEVRRGTRAG